MGGTAAAADEGDDFVSAETRAGEERHYFDGTRRFNSSTRVETTRISDDDSGALSSPAADPDEWSTVTSDVVAANVPR